MHAHLRLPAFGPFLFQEWKQITLHFLPFAGSAFVLKFASHAVVTPQDAQAKYLNIINNGVSKYKTLYGISKRTL